MHTLSRKCGKGGGSGRWGVWDTGEEDTPHLWEGFNPDFPCSQLSPRWATT